MTFFLITRSIICQQCKQNNLIILTQKLGYSAFTLLAHLLCLVKSHSNDFIFLKTHVTQKKKKKSLDLRFVL